MYLAFIFVACARHETGPLSGSDNGTHDHLKKSSSSFQFDYGQTEKRTKFKGGSEEKKIVRNLRLNPHHLHILGYK